MVRLSLVLHCSALAPTLNTLGKNWFVTAQRRILSRSYHTHVALAVDTVRDGIPNSGKTNIPVFDRRKYSVRL